MKQEHILKQSEVAYTQWAEQWRRHAVEHAKYEKKSLSDFKGIGVGKAILLVANGYSFEEQIETIKANKDNVDIMCCDKSLGHLLNNGITPTYCVVCDANVDYDKYLKPYKDQLQDTVLFINVCGNPEWTAKGNWKSRYFFANKDVIQSEKEFSKLSGTPNIIIAGTNVSNAMLILLTQCETGSRENFFGYDKYILTGYDYSWKLDGNYYAFDKDAQGKDNYMKHLYFYADDGTPMWSSGNLHFSKQWIEEYVRTFHLPVVQTAKHSTLQFGPTKDLAYQMQYRYNTDDANILKLLKTEFQKGKSILSKIDYTINDIEKKHFESFLKSI